MAKNTAIASSLLPKNGKIYILDTNILLQSPDVMYGFDDNEVIITGTTLQELGNKKKAPGEVGYNARRAIKNIDAIIGGCSPTSGIKIYRGGNTYKGIFRIVIDQYEDNLPNGFSPNVADNRIISTAMAFTCNCKNPVYLIANDLQMRLSAGVCGVKAQQYFNDQVDPDLEFSGRREIEKEYVEGMRAPSTMLPNEFAILKKDNKSALCMNKNGILELIKHSTKTSYCTPKNVAQIFAMKALLAPASEIPLVILRGPAGSAKTFLSLAAGLEGVYRSQTKNGYQGIYDKVVITRTNVCSDEPIGYLPGSLEEKMSPLIAPFTDNLATLLRNKEENPEQVNMQIQDMFDTGVIEIVSMAYMRGRSLNNSFIIIDEAQNATKNQIVTIATRIGIGSKLVILGDPSQVDNPKLDKKNNGLAYISDKMKGYKGCAQLTFTGDEIVRSELAMEAANRLTN